MKRVYLILTLFMTSFFLLSSNVKADSIQIELSESIFNRINDTFLVFREKAIEYANNNNKHYIIIYADSKYKAYMFDKDTLESSNPNFIYTNSLLRFNVSASYVPCSLNSANNLSCSGSGSSFKQTFINSSNSISYLYFLDTSYDNFYYFGNAINDYLEYDLIYKNLTYQIIKNNKIPTLYEIHQDYQFSQVNPKAEIITNFYTLILDKIKLLTNYIATDYIILSALVIFIFVAVIGLVRRLK